MRALLTESSAAVSARILPAPSLIELVRGVVTAGGSLWVQVTGISMNPVLREGDSVLLAPLERAPRRGDVLFIALGERPLLHRVRRVERGDIVTRGDAALTDDAPVSLADCVARALAVRRGSVTVALTPTLEFGLRGLLWFGAWTIRASLPSWMGRRVQRVSRAITRALS